MWLASNRQRVADLGCDSLRAAIEALTDKEDVSRREERIAAIEEISANNKPLHAMRQYPIILADPPWTYDFQSSPSRAIENHYPTMALEEICALPVASLAAEHAILYLWTTAPKLEEGMQVLKSWGFTYRTSMVWVKDKIGMGKYVRSSTRICHDRQERRVSYPRLWHTTIQCYFCTTDPAQRKTYRTVRGD